MSLLKRFGRWFLKQLGTIFLTGIVIILPLGLTILVLRFLFEAIDSILQPIIHFIFGHNIPGLGFAVIVIIIWIIGAIATNWLGKRIYYYLEQFFFYRIPVVKQLYQGIKQILESFSSSDNTRFLQVVLVEFPRKGLWSLGLVTNKVTDDAGKVILHVFVPHSPNPITGFVLMMKEAEVIYTKMTVEEAFKMIISAGRYTTTEGTNIATNIHNQKVE